MAIVIESTSISDYVGGTDIGSDTQFTIAPPSGITDGELLLVYLQGARTTRTVNLPSGFTGITLPNADSQVVKFGYKYASSESGGYTFTVTADDNADARWAMYRLSGAQSSGVPTNHNDGFSDTADGTSMSNAIDVTTVTGGLLFTFITAAELGASNASGFSALSLTGATVSMTERFDSLGSPSAGTATYGALYDGIPSAEGDITNISFTHGDDTGDDDTVRTSVYFILPQQNASTTPTFTTTGNTAFAPTGQAGAQTTPVFIETTNEAFAPTGRATTQTNWAAELKPTDANLVNET